MLLQMKLRLIIPRWAVTVVLAVTGERDKQKLLIRVWQAIICYLIFISGTVFIYTIQPVITSSPVIDEEPIVTVPSTVRRLCNANYQAVLLKVVVGGVSHGTVQGKVLILPALTWLLVSWEPCNHHIRVSESDATWGITAGNEQAGGAEANNTFL